MKGLLDANVRVHPVWARVLAVFWVLVSLGVAAVAISSDLIGRPVWWADEQRWPYLVLYALGLLFLLPSVLMTVLSLLRGPWVHLGAWIVSVELAALALVDRNDSPGSAVVLAALAVASLLAGVAALSARSLD
jgi:membrane protease YdiL (CAAX protease family)